MDKDERNELESIRYLQKKLKKQAVDYINKNGLDKFLSLPPWENFTLNRGKYERLNELLMLETEDKLMNGYE